METLAMQFMLVIIHQAHSECQQYANYFYKEMLGVWRWISLFHALKMVTV